MYNAVYNLLNNEIVKGVVQEDGIYYLPLNLASRLEFAKVFVKSFCNDLDPGADDYVEKCLARFNYNGTIYEPLDLADITDEEVKKCALVAYNLGAFGEPLATPYVNWGGSILRIEVARFLARAFDLKWMPDAWDYLKPYEDMLDLSLDDQVAIELVNYYGYLRGEAKDNKYYFYPLRGITRGELAIVADRILKAPKFVYQTQELKPTVKTQYPVLEVDTDGKVKLVFDGGSTTGGQFGLSDFAAATVKIFLDGELVKQGLLNEKLSASLAYLTENSVLDVVMEKDNMKAVGEFALYSLFPDTDGDGIADLDDIRPDDKMIYYADEDNDGLDDLEELFAGLSTETSDTDGDGISDKQEYAETGRDTDNDGIIDALDTDSDNDGVSDAQEITEGTDPYDSSSVQTVKVNLEIEKGWNLLGMGIEPLAGELDDMVSEHKDTIISMWKWTGTTWAVTLPGMSSEDVSAYIQSKGFERLQELHAGEGFWLNAKEGFWQEIEGKKAATTEPALKTGWNLVAPLADNPIHAATWCAGKDIVSLWKWENNTWSVYLPEKDDGGKEYAASKGFELLGDVQPGEGFWVNKK
jgi:hypothetical protein